MVNIIFKTVLKTVPQRRFIEMSNNIRCSLLFFAYKMPNIRCLSIKEVIKKEACYQTSINGGLEGDHSILFSLRKKRIKVLTSF